MSDVVLSVGDPPPVVITAPTAPPIVVNVSGPPGPPGSGEGGGGGGVTDHGALTGLADPDHPIAAVQGLQAALDGKAATAHTHSQAQSHGSPDTDQAASSLHHTLGTGPTQAAPGNHSHTPAAVGADPAGTAVAQVTAHELAADPHPVYLTTAEGNTAFAPAGHTHTQAQSHGSPDTDSAPAALHHTLGTGANQAAAGTHTHTQAQSHGSPDTDLAASSLHHTLGTGANQAAAGTHLHTGVYDPAGTAAARTPKITVATSAPSSPTVGDVWINST